jgi:hypothetical protein
MEDPAEPHQHVELNPWRRFGIASRNSLLDAIDPHRHTKSGIFLEYRSRRSGLRAHGNFPIR